MDDEELGGLLGGLVEQVPADATGLARVQHRHRQRRLRRLAAGGTGLVLVAVAAVALSSSTRTREVDTVSPPTTATAVVPTTSVPPTTVPGCPGLRIYWGTTGGAAGTFVTSLDAVATEACQLHGQLRLTILDRVTGAPLSLAGNDSATAVVDVSLAANQAKTLAGLGWSNPCSTGPVTYRADLDGVTATSDRDQGSCGAGPASTSRVTVIPGENVQP